MLETRGYMAAWRVPREINGEGRLVLNAPTHPQMVPRGELSKPDRQPHPRRP